MFGGVLTPMTRCRAIGGIATTFCDIDNIRGQKLNTNFFFANFSCTTGISQQNPGISRQKSLFPWFRGTYRTFWPLHVEDPHPTGKHPGPKVWVWGGPGWWGGEGCGRAKWVPFVLLAFSPLFYSNFWPNLRPIPVARPIVVL